MDYKDCLPKIEAEIKALLTRENDDAFLIIEEQGSKKFLQFAGNANEELLFDLPTGQLSKEQLTKAETLLLEFDIKAKDLKLYKDNSKKEETGQINVFSQKINNDIGLALDLVKLVLEEVYEVKASTKIQLEIN